MLELMLLDPAQHLIWAPCYHGMNKAKACTPDMWTDKRYSEAVVASMSAALDRFDRGLSGAGLLGIAGRPHWHAAGRGQPKTETVITVAQPIWIRKLGPHCTSNNP